MNLFDLIEGQVVSYYPEHKVCFSSLIVNKLNEYIQNEDSSNEAGGLLIGYRREQHFEITDITIPYKKDKRSRFYFERNDKTHLKQLKAIRFLSFGRKTFLGEWHTHPEKIPTPSSLDLTEWQKTIDANDEILLFLILGQDEIFIKTSDIISERRHDKKLTSRR